MADVEDSDDDNTESMVVSDGEAEDGAGGLDGDVEALAAGGDGNALGEGKGK